ncbi:meiotically up-regulated gene 190 protein [Lineolata rhizophorae]|uniref:Meiotically up-regulated gene 190 protein n=1 Tax=Lineolata rhizophorae TaxID=578093 RepID=A0A6A6NTP9_9PEZI|nr:meiotically up-regulated gene 190 protein [Lineolata rhizophorae]
MSGVEDTQKSRRKYKAPYTAANPIPTISHYREEKQKRKAQAGITDEDEVADEPGRIHRTLDALVKGRSTTPPPEVDEGAKQHYQPENKNFDQVQAQQEEGQEDLEDEDAQQQLNAKENEEDGAKDTSQAVGASDPKERRKQMQKRKGDRAEREVTDPITHLPVVIHDFTVRDIEKAPQNEPPPDAEWRSARGTKNAAKSRERLGQEQEELQEEHNGMEQLFPPPDFDAVREAMVQKFQQALTVGVGIVTSTLVVMLLAVPEKVSFILPIFVMLSIGVVAGMRQWLNNKASDAWETEVWEAERRQGKEMSKSKTPESTQWLNSLLSSIWPLVNPDLFTSLADTLEDVMQASLPKLVRMVSVNDIGQGSEAIRILGIRWLPTGAAAKSVANDGKLVSAHDRGDTEDGSKAGAHDHAEEKAAGKQEDENQNVSDGMEAEEGDFVNMEVAFAYRARSTAKSLATRAKNAHLYLEFYLPSNIKFPVWVELHGVVGTIRVRFQLTPDPPFFSLCTFTFLGQPKVDVSCVPLTKRGLDIMDLPLLSNFVQSSVDAAVAEYVAPKSLSLDLKEMLVGDDFKKDTSARGVMLVRIKRAFGFKEGDSSMPGFKDGSSDPFISVGWAKFGKPMWSTRIIKSEMEPSWDETAYVLVTPQELDVDENLRVQLWDSDRFTADDDLGRIEVDLKELMRNPNSNGRMWDRQDGFRSLTAGEGMPGQLEWSVGYYSKVRILDSQLAEQTADPDVKNMDQLKQKVYEDGERKLREAKKDESSEIEQQKKQDLKEHQDALLISCPPPEEYPSGILSIQIHQITGLEVEKPTKGAADQKDSASDEEEEGDDLPSAYCTVILNHKKIYRTRTKPKNSKPFFNASTERFISDWRAAEIHISVRDARVHEDDPLLGVVHLQLGELLSRQAQVNGFFPLAGGIGFGRVRLSMMFRSVQLQAPPQAIGWQYGTVDLQPKFSSQDLPEDLHGLSVKVKTSLGKAKFKGQGRDGESGAAIWKTKHGKSVALAVRKRYASNVTFEWRSHSAFSDHMAAFAVLWLKDIADDEDQTVSLPVWKNGNFERASNNVLETCGDKVGTIDVHIKFWPGLSGYHSKIASGDIHVAQVMEVLDAAEDNDQVNEEEAIGTEDHEDGYDSSSSSSSSSEDEDGSKFEKDGRRGPMDQLQDYKSHRKQLHRRNRGLMQWKGPRTAYWLKRKFEHGGQSISDVFNHHTREPGIETEV